MLDHNGDRSARSGRFPSVNFQKEKSAAENEREALFAAFRGLRRHAHLITLTTIIGTGLIIGVTWFGITPQYRAVTTILVDSRQSEILNDRQGGIRQNTDNSAIESEVEFIRSPGILRQVVEDLELHKDPAFNGGGSLLGSIKWLLTYPFTAAFKDSNENVDHDAVTRATEALAGKVHASRRNLTYVIELSVWSESGSKAAEFANKIAEVYLNEQIESRSETTRQATRWLKDEVERARDRLIESEDAYEAYKAEAGLFNPGGLNLTDRQIAQLNEQLVMARARAAEAEAKYKQLRQITADNVKSAASSPDTLQSAVLSNLRNHYASTARKYDELSGRYGPRHPRVVAVTAELENLSKQIADELERIVASAKTEVEMAKSRQTSLQESLDQLKISAAKFNKKAVKLRELEREVQANRALFEAFLSRAKEASAQLNLNLSDSRVLSPANAPLSPAYPRTKLMIGLGFFGSFGLGIFLAMLRNMFTAGFQRAADLQTALGLQPLATIPRIEQASPPSFKRLAGASGRIHSAKLTRLIAENSNGEETRLANLLIDEPNSLFAERIHSLNFALRQVAANNQLTSIMLSSALPGEGKSTVAINLARAAAMHGQRVLLIDGDLRRPTLAHRLELPQGPGLVDVVKGRCDPAGAILRDRVPELHLMAGKTRLSAREALGLLAAPALPRILADLRSNFDLILVDSSPLLPIADARLLADLCDGIALIIASEQTTRMALKSALEESPQVQRKLSGVIMNFCANEFPSEYAYYSNYEKVA